METTYAYARTHLSSLCDHATATLEPVVIHRRGADDVALVSAGELRSLQETFHELRSPRNAARLFSALAAARGRASKLQSIGSARRALCHLKTR